MSRSIKKGTSSQSTIIRIVDSVDGTPETGVVAATAGLDLEYRREGGLSVDITESDLTNLDSAYSSGGIKHIGNGYYRVDVPDAALATGADGVLVHGTVTGMIVLGSYHPLVGHDPQDGVRLGLTALPNAAAEAAGGLYTRGTAAGQINQDATGRVDVNIKAIDGGTTPATNLELTFDDTAGAVPWVGIIDQGTAQSVTSTTIVLRAAAAFADDELNGAVVVITGGTTGVGQRRVINDYAGAADTATVDAWVTTPTGAITYKIFWAASLPTSALANLDVAVSSRMATYPQPTGFLAATFPTGTISNTTNITSGTVTTVSGNVNGSVASVTGNVGGNVLGNVNGSVASVTGNVSGNVSGSVGSVVATVASNITQINGSTTGVAGLDRASRTVTLGTVGAGSTTTSIVTSSLTPAASVTDQFKGLIVKFAQDTTTVALRGQGTDITASTAGGTLTVTALTTAAVSGDVFSVQ